MFQRNNLIAISIFMKLKIMTEKYFSNYLIKDNFYRGKNSKLYTVYYKNIKMCTTALFRIILQYK